jgi:NitT/TauT family transport system permease protein
VNTIEAKALDREGLPESTVVHPNDPRVRRSIRSLIARTLSILVCITLWQTASVQKWHFLVNFENVPAPSAVGLAGIRLIQSPKFQNHVQSSVIRTFAGFGIAAVLAVTTGLLVGRSKLLGDFLMTPLELLRPIPAVAWIPLAVLMFPAPEESMIYITFIGAFFPILLSTIHGVTNVDQRLVFASLTLGASPFSVFSEVIVPGALPSIVTGLSIGMGNAWFSLVTAEMVSGQFGIGYYTWESYTLQNYPNIVLGMISIGLLGMVSSALIKRIAMQFMPWARKGGEMK